jgi:hypothetical protein
MSERGFANYSILIHPTHTKMKKIKNLLPDRLDQCSALFNLLSYVGRFHLAEETHVSYFEDLMCVFTILSLLSIEKSICLTESSSFDFLRFLS